jgi:chemotaxis protein MotB
MTPFVAPPEKAEESSALEAPWLITFSDLFCLLLAFFVLLFSMSALETGKWQTLKQAFSKYQETPYARPADTAPSDEASGGIKPQPGLDLGYLGKIFEAHAKDNVLLQNAVIYRVGEKLIISLPADLLFAPGAAAVDPKGESAVFGLAGLLRNIANDLVVMGHTDPTPVSGAYESNWDLSLARAAAVAAALEKSGYGRAIESFGVADSHFAELPDSMPLERRRELARRVDVIVTPNR